MMASNSKVVIFLMIACLSLAVIRVESRMGETFLQRVQRAYTQANSEYYPVRNTKFTQYQIPEELKASDPLQTFHLQNWELKDKGPIYQTQEIKDNVNIDKPIKGQPTFSTESDVQGAATNRFNAQSNKYGTREAAVHHTIPASQRNDDREETTQSMGTQTLGKASIAGYMRPDATSNERFQSTFMNQYATGEEYMPQELSREAMVRHTMPESIPQGTRWSHAEHTNPTFMPQSNHKWAQTERHALPTSRPQHTTRHTWAQGKRATITAMLNGMGEGGDK